MWDYGCDRKLVKESATHAGQCRLFHTYRSAFGGAQFFSHNWWKTSTILLTLDYQKNDQIHPRFFTWNSSSFFPEGCFFLDCWILNIAAVSSHTKESCIAPRWPAGGRHRLLQVPGSRFGLPGGCLPTREAINHNPLSDWSPCKLAPRASPHSYSPI